MMLNLTFDNKFKRTTNEDEIVSALLAALVVTSVPVTPASAKRPPTITTTHINDLDARQRWAFTLAPGAQHACTALTSARAVLAKSRGCRRA
jgi:hypothetical protein